MTYFEDSEIIDTWNKNVNILQENSTVNIKVNIADSLGGKMTGDIVTIDSVINNNTMFGMPIDINNSAVKFFEYLYDGAGVITL